MKESKWFKKNIKIAQERGNESERETKTVKI